MEHGVNIGAGGKSAHRKNPPTGAVKGHAVNWRKVAEDPFVDLHVLVGGRRQDLPETSRTRGLASTHDGHFVKTQ